MNNPPSSASGGHGAYPEMTILQVQTALQKIRALLETRLWVLAY